MNTSSHTKSLPLVSVCMMLFNESRFVRSALDSLLKQDYPNWELIVSDNCSTDDTWAIVREYAKRDGRIRSVRQPSNIGVKSGEIAINMAKGDYLMVAAGHDHWEPSFISSCVAELVADSSVIMAYPKALWIDVNGNPLQIIPTNLDTRSMTSAACRLNVVLWGLGYSYQMYGLFRRGFFDGWKAKPMLAPDNLLLAKAAIRGTFAQVPQVLFHMRRMDDYGSWESYVSKLFCKSLASGDLNPEKIYFEMVEEFVSLVNTHFPPGFERDSILPSVVLCLFSKYQGILHGVSAAAGHTGLAMTLQDITRFAGRSATEALLLVSKHAENQHGVSLLGNTSDRREGGASAASATNEGKRRQSAISVRSTASSSTSPQIASSDAADTSDRPGVVAPDCAMSPRSVHTERSDDNTHHRITDATMAGSSRVLFVNRPDALHIPGGDTEHMLQLKAGLERLGVRVDICCDLDPDPTGYDLVNIFNLLLPRITLRQVRAIRERSDLPIVLTPFFWDRSEALWGEAAVPHAVATASTPHALEQALHQIAVGTYRVGRLTRLGPNTPYAECETEQRECLSYVKHLIPISARERAILAAAFDLKAADSTVVPTGVGLPQKPASPNPFVARYGVKDFVLVTGRVETRKNQLMLLMALRETGLPIVIAGAQVDAGYLSLCRKIAPPDTHIVGRLDPEMLRSARAAAKVHALPSWWECAGIASMEAALAGCSVVMGNHGAELEYFGTAAYYCRPSDAISIRQAVVSAYTHHDADAQRRIALNGSLRTLYNWDAIAARTLEVYRGIIASNTSASRPGVTTKNHGRSHQSGDDLTLPEAALKHLRAAELSLTNRDFETACERLSQAVSLVPNNPELIIMLGHVKRRLGDVEGARREFVKATVLHPDFAPAHTDLAAVLLHLGRVEEAEVSARRALELDSTNIGALKVLGKVCLDTERYQEAVQAYAMILQHAPNDIETLILVGNCYAEVGRPEEAKAFFCRVLQLDPDHAVAVENLAIVSGQRPSSTWTSPVVEETIESDPRHVSTDVSHDRMSRNRIETSPDASSIREETVSPRLSSVDKVTEVLQRVETHIKNEDLYAASRVLTKAIVQTPDNPDLIVASGHVAWKQGDLEKARLQFVRAATLEPNHAGAHTALAVLFLQQRQFAEAEEAAQKALTIDGTEVTALKVLAKICLDAERYQEAVQAYATILQHAPNDIETLIRVGNCYAESGRFEQARSFYRKVLMLDPGNAVAKDNLMLLDGKEPASDACELRDANPGTPLTPYPLPLPPSASRLTSIIIVTYNSASTIRACLDSVLTGSRPATDVIVVDNLSTDETRSILCEYQGRIATILNPDNVGFAAACNQGIRASSGDYVVLLNPDTVVTSGWLERLLAHMRPCVGAVGPVSDYVAGLQKCQLYLPADRPVTMTLHELADVLGGVNRRRAVETRLLIGFCLAAPRKVLDEVGLLDEDLFLGNDDLDLSWRLRLRGYRLLVATDAFVHHEGQVSFKSEAETRTSRLVQDSTDRLYAKLEAHYGVGNVPSPMELWGIDWFKPTKKSDVPLTPHASRLTSIIILTHNGLEHTKACLAGIETHTTDPYELIIVDNASSDGTLDYLRDYTANHDHVRVVANWTNRGFAAGNNQGLALAKGEYVLLLNNDTIVTEGWLRRMLRVFEAHPDVGIVGPMSNYVSGPQLVRDASYGSPAGLDDFAAQWARDHDGQSGEATRVVGFCLLARKAVIARIGGLDERFGSGNFEDDDFCIRAFQVGFRARIALDAFVHHTGSQTFKTAGIDYRQSLMRNWGLFKAKWGIPADTSYEAGYHFPSQSAENVSLSIPLSDVGADHRCSGDGRWWREISEDPGRCEPAVMGETPFSAIIIPNGHGIAPLWPSLIQHTNQPLAVTIVPSIHNGNGSVLPPQTAYPDGWQVGTADEPAVWLLNRLLQSGGDDPVILLSGDVVVTPGWLKRLLTACERNPHLAMVGPAMNDGGVPQQVKADYKGTGKALRQFALRRAHRYGKQLVETESLVPSCIVFNPTVCRSVGPLREDLNLTASLAEYCVRARQSGHRVAAALDAYVHCD